MNSLWSREPEGPCFEGKQLKSLRCYVEDHRIVHNESNRLVFRRVVLETVDWREIKKKKSKKSKGGRRYHDSSRLLLSDLSRTC